MPTVTPVNAFTGLPTGQQATNQITPTVNKTPLTSESVQALVQPPVAEGTVTTDQKLGTEDIKEGTGEPMSPQYAALARKERAVRSQVRQLEEQKLAHQKELEAFKADRELLQLLETDPWTALAKKGISYDKLVESQINQPNPELKALRDELAAVKEELAKTSKQTKDAGDQRWNDAVRAITADVTELVSEGDTYETIKKAGRTQDVVELITRTYQNGETITIEDAAQAVEDALLEEAEEEYKLLSQLNKLKNKLAPTSQEAPASAQTQKPQATTLTGSMASTRQLSAKERAILAFNGQLKP